MQDNAHWIKLHLLSIVLTTQFSALFFHPDNVPYFPIEVSRTAASGEWSHIVFVTGVLSLGGTLYRCGLFRYPFALPWLGLTIVALFDDVGFWALHMAGFACMVAGTGLVVRQSSTYDSDVRILVFAVLLFAFRVALKVCAVLGDEMNMPLFSTSTWISMAFDPSVTKEVFDRALKIMYVGAAACDGRYTLAVFRIGGLLQWVVFVMMSSVLHE